MRAPRDSVPRPKAAKPEHPLQWLAEPLANDPGFECKSWFGGRTLMLDGQHRLFLTAQGEPWQGALVCTSREHHESLLAEFPSLVRHPVLGKWLYLPESADSFEADARRLVQLASRRDPRIGVASSAGKKRKVKKIRFGEKL